MGRDILLWMNRSSLPIKEKKPKTQQKQNLDQQYEGDFSPVGFPSKKIQHASILDQLAWCALAINFRAL